MKDEAVNNELLLRFFREQSLPFGQLLRAFFTSIGAALPAEQEISVENVADFIDHNGSTTQRTLYNVKIITYMVMVHRDDKIGTVQSEIRKLANVRDPGTEFNNDQDYIDYVCDINDADAAALYQKIVDANSVRRATKQATIVARDFIERGVKVGKPADNATALMDAIAKNMLGNMQQKEEQAYAKRNIDDRNRKLEDREIKKCGIFGALLQEKLTLLWAHDEALCKRFNEVIRFKFILANLDDTTRERKIKYALSKLAIVMRRKNIGLNDAANDIADRVFDGVGKHNAKFSLEQILTKVGSLRQLFRGRETDFTADVRNHIVATGHAQASVANVARFIERNPDQTEASERLERRIQKVRLAFANLDLHDATASATDNELDGIETRLPLFAKFQKHYGKLLERTRDPRASSKPINVDPAAVEQKRIDELAALKREVELQQVKINHELTALQATPNPGAAQLIAHLRALQARTVAFRDKGLAADPAILVTAGNITQQAEQIIKARAEKDEIVRQYTEAPRPR